MANEQELNPKYIILQWDGTPQLQIDVNEYIGKGYIPYGPMFIDKYGNATQVMIDPLVLEKQQVTIRKGVITATSTVTIPGTVNVSGCGG